MSDTTKKIVKAGGAKGEAIAALLKEQPHLTRAQVAEKAGATVGRVGEVVRWLAGNGTADQKKVIAAHVKAQPVRTAKKAAPAKTTAKTTKKAPAKSAPAKAAAATPANGKAAK